MSDLTGPEKRALERVLAMGGGYILDFSNRTFSEFVMDSTGRDIYDARYDCGSGSKANRLRGSATAVVPRSEEHTSESSHTVISYAVFCLKKKKNTKILRRWHSIAS